MIRILKQSNPPAAGRLFLAILAFLAGAIPWADEGAAETFTNPIVADGADPWIIYREGYYYLTYTTGSSVLIHRATHLA
ncbi:MAG TPA: hypothetical protein VHI52_16010, partial [Verrucomicrobiae bacterium]|nr:hypothetical protein [Verrucomicrobiae bacterium]